MYEYHMVEMPPNVAVSPGQGQGAAAKYLQGVVDQFAGMGWEYYSIESIGVVERVGCGCLAFLLSMLLSYKPTHTQTCVVVFRRPRAGVQPRT